MKEIARKAWNVAVVLAFVPAALAGVVLALLGLFVVAAAVAATLAVTYLAAVLVSARDGEARDVFESLESAAGRVRGLGSEDVAGNGGGSG